MKTEKQKLLAFFKNKGFALSPVLQHLDLVPHHRKDPDGTHMLVSRICCTLFDGINTKNGDLGCVSFYYSGLKRPKHKRNAYFAEMLKQTELPKTAEEAILDYKHWQISTAKTLRSWQTII